MLATTRGSATLALALLALAHAAAAAAGEGTTTELSIFLSSGGATHREGIVSGANAYIQFDQTYNTTGWAVLHAWTPETTSHEAAVSNMYAAGWGEGYATQAMIYPHYLNMVFENFPPSAPMTPKMRSFMKSNLAWTERTAKARAATDSDPGTRAYWANVLAVLQQLRGLADGYNAAAPADEQLTHFDLLLLNMDGDIETLLAFLGTESARKARLEVEKPRLQRCSALIKVAPNASDLFAGHATWDSFEAMVRIYKHYRFAVPVPAPSTGAATAVSVALRSTSFSASPAFLASVDDFYVTSQGLVVIETTNGVYNSSLFAYIKDQGQVMSWIRSIVANTLAEDGAQWVDIFRRYNSGTYNNQWIIVDTKRFKRGHGPGKGTLWIAEQIPGTVVAADQSHHLARDTYWGSYNIPFYPTVYNASGFAAKSGNAWSHEHCPRANIFRARQAGVSTLRDARDLLRYNNWLQDPLSLGDPADAISARADLRPNPTPSDFFGGIDVKVTNLGLTDALTAWAENGPTHDQQPVFDWAAAPRGKVASHGQPRRWNFTTVPMAPHWSAPAPVALYK